MGKPSVELPDRDERGRHEKGHEVDPLATEPLGCEGNHRAVSSRTCVVRADRLSCRIDRRLGHGATHTMVSDPLSRRSVRLESQVVKAIQLVGSGDPPVLEPREVPAPQPGAGEVVVALRAAALNRRDPGSGASRARCSLSTNWVGREAPGIARPVRQGRRPDRLNPKTETGSSPSPSSGCDSAASYSCRAGSRL